MNTTTDTPVLTESKPQIDASMWQEVVAKYQQPSLGRSIWQLVNTIVPYVAIWCLMYWSMSVSYWLTLPLTILAAGLLVRIFIIHHDCGHGSFFKSRRVNDIVGFITGIITWTPYYHWRWEHSVHHATSGDLDGRGLGDVWTLTVQEYLESSRWRRFAYRLARNPIILFVIAPLFMFLVWQRIPKSNASKRERHSVHWTNLTLLGLVVALSWVFGIKAYILIQLTVTGVAGAAGVWLFYVQHQFDGVYWERRDNWDYFKAALQGSSFYKLPKVLQWFTGNIGFHHIHHLSSRIPNYHLEKAHKAEPMFQTVKPVTLFGSLKSFTYRLWDEKRRKLVGYRHLRTLRKQQRHAGRS